MMDAFRIWLIGLMAVSLILTVLSTLLPEGSIKKIAGVTGGLVLLLTILRGVSRLDLAGLRLSYDDCAQEIDRQMESYRLQSSRDMESLIQARCGAYISEQAQTLGLSCSPVWKRNGRRKTFPCRWLSQWIFHTTQSCQSLFRKT